MGLFGGGSAAAVAFVHMLLAAEEKHPELKVALRGFAKLVCEKVAETAYFVNCYLMVGCALR